MDLQLRGLKAIVSGGTKGIGRAIAETLAAEGAHVGLCARQATEVEATVAALRLQGATAEVYPIVKTISDENVTAQPEEAV